MYIYKIYYVCIYNIILYTLYFRHAHTLQLFSLSFPTLFLPICCRLSVFPFHTLFHSVKNSSVIFYPHIPQFSILNLYSNMQSHRIFFRCHVRSFRRQPASSRADVREKPAGNVWQNFDQIVSLQIKCNNVYYYFIVFLNISGVYVKCTLMLV